MKEEAVNLNGFECRIISSNGKGPCIVLLHGYMYTSDVWNDIGLLRLLEQKNIAFKAVDMPYGRKSECIPKSNNPEQNAAIVARITSSDSLIIGASLGGYIALKHCVANPVGGLMLIAPVMGLQGELVSRYSLITAPVSLIYGEYDNVVYKDEIKRLAKLLGISPKFYQKAQHAAYMDQPELFKKDVTDFYDIVVRKKQEKNYGSTSI
jgi:pimeloyl-ACP methyl ester carboxylesterase